MSMKNKKTSRQRHDFLLTFFKKEDPSGKFREVNDYFLQKQWNGNTSAWQVAIYSKESWAKHEAYNESQPNLDWIV